VKYEYNQRLDGFVGVDEEVVEENDDSATEVDEEVC
jgi:hypothetical protein